MTRVPFTPAIAWILLTTAAWAGNVLVVDASGGGTFTQIQDAVDAAQDGDVLLLKSGAYSTFVVPDKDLAIVADTGATVTIAGGVRVRNLASGKTIVLSNLSATGVTPPVGFEKYGFFATNCAGSVRVQNCTFTGGAGAVCATNPLQNGVAGAHVEYSADVSFARCTLRGGQGSNDPNLWYGRAGEALTLSASNVILYSVECRGGQGTVCCDGGSGGHGVVLTEAAYLFASGLIAIGGAGVSAGQCPPCANGGHGGWGIRLSGASVARLQPYAATGGAAGIGYSNWGCPPRDVDGSPGYPLLVSTGSVVDAIAGTPRNLIASPVVREGGSVLLIVSGNASESVSYYVGAAGANAWQPEASGHLLVEASVPARQLLAGTIVGSGELAMLLPVPDLPPGVQARVVHVQPLLISPAGALTLGEPAAIVVLDAAY